MTGPAIEQTGYFRATEVNWRGVINCEDLTVGALMDILVSASDAGMSHGALVEIKPGDCVINVRVKDTHIVNMPRRDEIAADRCGCDPDHDDCTCGCHGPLQTTGRSGSAPRPVPAPPTSVTPVTGSAEPTFGGAA